MTDTQALATPKLSFNQAYLQGKIVSKRKLKTQSGALHLTLVRLASKDEFSHPATIELRSSEVLGDADESIKVKVQLGGAPNNYKRTYDDPESGETKTEDVRTARNEYTVIFD